ncbi:hypothetical protein OESDEN_13319 [Oesophagostomum dentatum]|uniref:Leucine--tRNA ligase ubiquitin-like domain-containing protein n=1 Tax=Oesophagostomum dentatum TaxID=61180 RepID=A0A0B1STQ7_OESDE|nr:hypothetical protein OESDEN_13319 [Oesophagostomum dentatum]
MKTCADKLKKETEDLDYPHWFPNGKEEFAKEEVSSIDEITKDKSKGKKVDWCRSFIITDANAYYDSFLDGSSENYMLQMKSIREKDGQPCIDHDRSTDEGGGPQQHIMIQLQPPVVLENRQYIENSLQLDRFSIKFTDEADVEPIISETVVPGASLMHFFPLREAINLTSRNVRVANALSDVYVEIMNGDSVAVVVRKLIRLNKSIKPRFNVTLWRYQDPFGEDRKMISCLDPLPFHEKLEDSAVFATDIEKRAVSLSDNGKAYLICDTIVYVAH